MISHIEKGKDVKDSPFSDLGSVEGAFWNWMWLCNTVFGRTKPLPEDL